MKIVIPAEGTDLASNVAHRFGLSPYLLVVDTERMDFKVLSRSEATAQHGTGIQAIVFAINEGAEVVLTGYCSPIARSQLASNGIKVITGVSGTVKEALDKYKAGDFSQALTFDKEKEPSSHHINRDTLVWALRSSARQFVNILPILIGVVLCIGLFNAFMPGEVLASIFSGNVTLDTLRGACFGSILAGNAINSYIIGTTLMDQGVSLFAVTAFLLTWVTVGLIQLPAEIASLGLKFALVRNTLCFILAIPVALLTVVFLKLITG